MEPVSVQEKTDVRTTSRLRIDDQGHAILFTDEERQARTEAVLKMVEELAAVPDDPPDSDEEFWKAMDEERPERPLYRGFYTP